MVEDREEANEEAIEEVKETVEGSMEMEQEEESHNKRKATALPATHPRQASRINSNTRFNLMECLSPKLLRHQQLHIGNSHR